MGQFLNASLPIKVTDAGIETDKRDSQEENALLAILETESGRLIVVNVLHEEKVPSLISLIVSGIETEVRLFELAKAYAPMEVTERGRITVDKYWDEEKA